LKTKKKNSKDIWGSKSESSSSVVGLAYVSSVCSSSKYLITEDIGGFAYAPVASHEIAHNLGAYHDGVSNPVGYSECNSSNIMAPASSVLQQYNEHVNRFSKCSINGFKLNLLDSESK